MKRSVFDDLVEVISWPFRLLWFGLKWIVKLSAYLMLFAAEEAYLTYKESKYGSPTK